MSRHAPVPYAAMHLAHDGSVESWVRTVSRDGIDYDIVVVPGATMWRFWISAHDEKHRAEAGCIFITPHYFDTAQLAMNNGVEWLAQPYTLPHVPPSAVQKAIALMDRLRDTHSRPAPAAVTAHADDLLRRLVDALPKCTGPFAKASGSMLRYGTIERIYSRSCDRTATRFVVNGADTSDSSCDECAAAVCEPDSFADHRHADALRAAIAYLAR